MKRSRLRDTFCKLLDMIGINTRYSMEVKAEEALSLLLSGHTCIECRHLNKDCRHIRVMQVYDAADVYNFFISLNRGCPITFTQRQTKCQYTANRLVLQLCPITENRKYIALLLIPADYRVNGVREIRFESTAAFR